MQRFFTPCRFWLDRIILVILLMSLQKIRWLIWTLFSQSQSFVTWLFPLWFMIFNWVFVLFVCFRKRSCNVNANWAVQVWWWLFRLIQLFVKVYWCGRLFWISQISFVVGYFKVGVFSVMLCELVNRCITLVLWYHLNASRLAVPSNFQNLFTTVP